MADKLHEVVQLLLARMESHPEEFQRGMSRWAWMVEGVMTSCSEEERAALHAGLRPIRLKQLHEDVMDELLNGEERRRKEQDDLDYELGILNKARNQRNMGASLRSALHPTSTNMEYNGIFNAIRNLVK